MNNTIVNPSSSVSNQIIASINLKAVDLIIGLGTDRSKIANMSTCFN